jgi:hypothetical protein
VLVFLGRQEVSLVLIQSEESALRRVCKTPEVAMGRENKEELGK